MSQVTVVPKGGFPSLRKKGGGRMEGFVRMALGGEEEWGPSSGCKVKKSKFGDTF